MFSNILLILLHILLFCMLILMSIIFYMIYTIFDFIPTFLIFINIFGVAWLWPLTDRIVFLMDPTTQQIINKSIAKNVWQVQCEHFEKVMHYYCIHCYIISLLLRLSVVVRNLVSRSVLRSVVHKLLVCALNESYFFPMIWGSGWDGRDWLEFGLHLNHNPTPRSLKTHRKNLPKKYLPQNAQIIKNQWPKNHVKRTQRNAVREMLSRKWCTEHAVHKLLYK